MEEIAIADGWFWKAQLKTEGEDRFVYCQPSNDNWDSQSEQMSQRALLRAAPGYLERGNVDIAHLSLLGRKLGIRHPELYEIGRPLEVFGDGTKGNPLVVKAIIYRGEGKAAEQAEIFWDSIARQIPPQVWRPSVGGRVLERDCRSDPRGCILKAVEWVNIAFAKTPVNQTVKAVCLSMDELMFAKALVAGYGTDTAQLTGGAALRRESLHPERVDTSAAIGFLRGDECPHTRGKPNRRALLAHLRECGGLAPDDANRTAEAVLARLRKRKAAAKAAREVS